MENLSQQCTQDGKTHSALFRLIEKQLAARKSDTQTTTASQPPGSPGQDQKVQQTPRLPPSGVNSRTQACDKENNTLALRRNVEQFDPIARETVALLRNINATLEGFDRKVCNALAEQQLRMNVLQRALSAKSLEDLPFASTHPQPSVQRDSLYTICPSARKRPSSSLAKKVRAAKYLRLSAENGGSL